jgi:ABC-type uncharacterized transport system substrate-binding protein
LRPDVVLTHASPATTAFRQATRTVPNVFVAVVDAVGAGFVQTVARPGGSSTGFTNFEPSLGSKWLQLLKDVAPHIRQVSVLLNPKTFLSGFGGPLPHAIQATAMSFDVTLSEAAFSTAEDIESLVGAIGSNQTTGVIVMPDTSTTLHGTTIVSSVARHRVPTVYPYGSFVYAGGLLSYGVDRSDLYRRAASYVDRILRGTAPANLPVQAPVKFELMINLKTAKALGLDVPPTLLALADEVIE